MKYFCCSNFLLYVFFSWLRVSDLILFFILSELFYFSKLVTSDSFPLWNLCFLFLLCITSVGYLHWPLYCSSICSPEDGYWVRRKYRRWVSYHVFFCKQWPRPVLDTLNGVPASSHETLILEFTVERTQLKAVPRRKCLLSMCVHWRAKPVSVSPSVYLPFKSTKRLDQNPFF